MAHYIYIHVPFCEARCPYCDFFTLGSGSDAVGLANRWLDLVRQELELWIASGDVSPSEPVATIYFGGGTPSLVSSAKMKTFLSAMKQILPWEPTIEITVEMQPRTADERKIAEYSEAGVNRFSVGAQSFTDKFLAMLERRHTVEDTLFLVDAVKKYGRLSIDLICALPGQSLKDWQQDLESALALAPEHLSVYELTFYRGTPLWTAMSEGKAHPSDESIRIAMFEYTAQRLQELGFEHYEISNFALPGARSRHNENYWKLGDYVGLGAGAHSFVHLHRYVNPPDIIRYEAEIRRGKLPRQLVDAEDMDLALCENLFMGLRLLEGLDLDLFQNKFGVDIRSRYSRQIEDLERAGLVELVGSRLRLTWQGALVADAVTSYFL